MPTLESSAAPRLARVTLGCFEVGGRTYAVDVAHVREVVRWQPVTPLPLAPKLIEGVIDLRGSVVPVIDLARALGVETREPGLHSRIAVAEIEGLAVGLVVERASEVIAVDVTSLEDPPQLATQAGYDMMRAMIRRPDSEPIPVLSLENLLERVYRSALEGEEGSA